MTRPTIRQNPTPAVKTPPGEMCPAHGWYERPRAVTLLRAAATGDPGVPVTQARRLLHDAVRLRRTCPTCNGPAPTMQQWAHAVARRVKA